MSSAEGATTASSSRPPESPSLSSRRSRLSPRPATTTLVPFYTNRRPPSPLFPSRGKTGMRFSDARSWTANAFPSVTRDAGEIRKKKKRKKRGGEFSRAFRNYTYCKGCMNGHGVDAFFSTRFRSIPFTSFDDSSNTLICSMFAGVCK